jgi:tRNA U34 5-methylaminomethyl-2-thiouridine-forming methyltransferase MnmC
LRFHRIVWTRNWHHKIWVKSCYHHHDGSEQPRKGQCLHKMLLTHHIAIETWLFTSSVCRCARQQIPGLLRWEECVSPCGKWSLPWKLHRRVSRTDTDDSWGLFCQSYTEF